jgi:hypothetical protein
VQLIAFRLAAAPWIIIFTVHPNVLFGWYEVSSKKKSALPIQNYTAESPWIKFIPSLQSNF